LNAEALAAPSIANFYAVKKQRCRKGTLVRHRSPTALSGAMCEGCRSKHGKLISIGRAKV
jgi:hypothetical protein